MKKYLAILLAAMLILSVCACSQKEDEGELGASLQLAVDEAAQNIAAATKKDSTNTDAPVDPEPEPEPDPEPEPEPEPEPVGTLLESLMFSVTYSEDVWQISEDGLAEEENYYSRITFESIERDPDAADYPLISVEIDVTCTDPDTYRDYVKAMPAGAYDIVENGAGEYVNVGGLDCLYTTGTYWGDPMLRYFTRVENAGATVIVRVTGEYENENVQPLLDEITFTIPDLGKIEPPWPWNGTPFTSGDMSAAVGDFTILSHQLPITGSIVVDDIFSGRVAVSGEHAYILTDDLIKFYAYDGSSFVYEKDIPLDNDYEELTVCTDGTVIASGFICPLIVLKDGEITAAYDCGDRVRMHPSGQWGVSYFTGNDIGKVTFVDGTVSKEEIILEAVKSVSSVSISNDHIMITGTSAANEHHAIFVYDLDFNLVCTLGDKEFGADDCLGSVTVTLETANGFVALDGNMREIPFWAKDGTYIGTLEDSDLFGTHYPWMSTAQLLPDGSIIAGLTEERPDKSADEFILFQLTGF